MSFLGYVFMMENIRKRYIAHVMKINGNFFVGMQCLDEL